MEIVKPHRDEKAVLHLIIVMHTFNRIFTKNHIKKFP